MKNAIAQHVVSIVGQVAAALPPIVVLVFLARDSGLEAAGVFSVVIGVSAAAFSTAFWGLRTAIVVDRFESATPSTYLRARLLALVLAAIVVALVARWLNVDVGLIIGLILFKFCDGLLDLDFARTQVLLTTQRAITAFAWQHGLKLVVLLAGLIIGVAPDLAPMQVAYALSGAIALLLSARTVLPGFVAGAGSAPTVSAIRQVIANAAWFAVAVAICSIVTSAPRFSLKWLYDGETLGVVGVTLSVSTLFGMILHTAWTRHLPRFEDQRSFYSVTARYLVEIALLAIIVAVASWWVLPQLVAALFAYHAPEQIALTQLVLLASVLFFTGMTTCNLYKVTSRPWRESTGYLLALLAAGAAAVAYAPARQIAVLLAVAGLVMLFCGVAAIGVPFRNRTLVTADVSTRA